MDQAVADFDTNYFVDQAVAGFDTTYSGFAVDIRYSVDFSENWTV